MMVKKNHAFHMVDPSPWPILTSFRAMLLAMGLVVWFRFYNANLFLLGIGLMIVTPSLWWRRVSKEAACQGLHTLIVSEGLKTGIILFIISELMLFVSFFWAFFHGRLSPSVELGIAWPPVGVISFNPFQIPLLNTVVLLSSGVLITWSHHSLIENQISSSQTSLILTWVLGAYFIVLQVIEYSEASFSISDSVFGSSFFLATGFHGFHVYVGCGMIIAAWVRISLQQFVSKSHHVGFEAAAWYWHFVDVVWLFLFISLYWWGG